MQHWQTNNRSFYAQKKYFANFDNGYRELFDFRHWLRYKKTDAQADVPAAVSAEAQNEQKAAETAMPAKMDMNQMMDMKHQCMSNNQSGKKCNHEMMSKCQETMEKKNAKK